MTIFVTTVEANLFTKRGHNKVMNALNRESMEFIRDVFLPKHFTTGAFSEYPSVFEKRAIRYQIRKAKKLGHQLPNVWTGKTRDLVLNSSVIRATATRGTLTARTHFPRNEQRRRELEHVSESEQATNAARLQRRYIEEAKDPANADKIRYRIR